MVKDDGLAAGKGVVVTADRDTARAHAASLLDAGHPVLLETFLDGPEVSLFSIVDGETVVPLLPAQDFKRVGDNDTGPNTGGMGAYDRCRGCLTRSSRDRQRCRETCCGGDGCAWQPVPGRCTRGWRSCRGGRRWSNSIAASAIRRRSRCWLCWKPPGALLRAAATGQLADQPSLRWRDGYAVTVVVAAENYPGRPRVGDVMVGAEADGVLHAGTARRDDGAIVSSGGRVLSVIGTGPDLAAARMPPTR